MHRLITIPLLLLLAMPGHTATIHVPGDYPTIQAGIDAAADGDVVLLADGTYRGDGNRDVDFLGKEIVVRSASDDPSLCVIDVEGTPQDNHRAFILRNEEGPNAGLRSLTITGGYLNGPLPTAAEGGAVYCHFSTHPFFERVHFEMNTSSDGGAVYVESGGNARFEDCVFLSCRSLQEEGSGSGAGVFLEDVTATLSRCQFIRCESFRGGALWAGSEPVVLTECDFEENVADPGSGGAINAGRPTITNCRFLRNYAFRDGGALYLSGGEVTESTFAENRTGWLRGGAVRVGDRYGPVTIRDCDFIGNTAPCDGGALYLRRARQTTVQRCYFENNRAIGADGIGGAILVGSESSGEVLESTFVDNFATQIGGAIHTDGESLTVGHCTLVGNSALIAGGIYALGGASLVEHTIVAFNRVGAAIACADGAATTVACSNIFGNDAGDWTGCIAAQADIDGNFSADPLFCDPAIGDFTVRPNSPCAPPGVTGCGLVGALPVGCGPVSVEEATWAIIKGKYR